MSDQKAQRDETASAQGSAAEVQREMMAALEPFALIGGWLFARDVPDDTPMVTFEGINGYCPVLTRGHFKAAALALRRAEAPTPQREEQR